MNEDPKGRNRLKRAMHVHGDDVIFPHRRGCSSHASQAPARRNKSCVAIPPDKRRSKGLPGRSGCGAPLDQAERRAVLVFRCVGGLPGWLPAENSSYLRCYPAHAVKIPRQAGFVRSN